MSWVIVAVTAMAVGTGTSVYGQIQSGKAQQESFERQAEEEKIAAESRELERKQELNRVLAANNVSQSMSGITGEGTPASISLESAKQIGTSEGMINLSEKLKRAQLRRQGAMARSTANVNATSTLLQGISSIAMLAASAGNDGPAPVEDKSFKKGS
jgi:hypothetical protein